MASFGLFGAYDFVYTFKTAMTGDLGSPGEVLIGGSAAAALTNLKAAINLSYDVCLHEMVRLAGACLAKSVGVMLVGRDQGQAERLRELVLRNVPGLAPKDVYLLSGNESIHFTDEEVAAGRVPDYKVVIVPVRKSEGYTLTRIHIMITSVYFTNNATREQIEGRINRIGQKSKYVDIHVIHAGLLTHTYAKHKDAKNLAAVLAAVAQEIKMRG